MYRLDAGATAGRVPVGDSVEPVRPVAVHEARNRFIKPKKA